MRETYVSTLGENRSQFWLSTLMSRQYIQEESKITATYLRDTYLYKDCCRRCALGLDNCNIAVGDAE